MAKPPKVEILDGHTIRSDQDAPQGFTEEPGMLGAFTREQAPGAIPNGTRIVKHYAQTLDANPVGAQGVVLGSIMDDQLGLLVGDLLAPALRQGNENAKYMYFVEWDSAPGRAVVVLGAKIRRADSLPQQAYATESVWRSRAEEVGDLGTQSPVREPEPDFKPGGGTFGGGGASGRWEEDKPSTPSESFGSCTPDSSSSSSDSGSSSSDSGSSDSGSSSSGSE